jgi:ATP-dependent helicase/nuclease subunit A
LSRSIIYRSSAGSGKTFTLIYSFLKILLGDAGRYNPNIYKQILAITFTNKAANEMKSRLVEDLTKIALGKNQETIFVKLKEELNLSDSEIQLRAKDSLEKILQNYGHLNILTIDSFFQSIIRSFSKELGLPLNYKIEMQLSFVQEAIVLGLYETALENKGLFKVLLNYALDQVKEGKSWNFEKSIVDFASNMFKVEANNYSYSEDEIKAIVSKLRKSKKDYFDKVASLAKECLDKVPSFIQDEDFAYKGDFIKNLRKLISLESDGELLKKLISESELKRFKKNISGEYPYIKTSTKKQEIEDYFQSIEEERGQLEECISISQLKIPNTANLILKNFYQVGLLQFLKFELAKYREENDTLLISDLTTFINKMIEDEDIPFIYEKRGSQFQYLLFDEFQDTSLQQWQNIFPLIEHILSQARSNETKVMLVGDAKQSIYRWRKGEIGLILNDAPQSLNDYGLKIENLSENYRSLENIISFNNFLFEQIKNNYLTTGDIDNLLSDVKQSVGKKNHLKGYVEINIIESSEEEKWKDLVLERVLENILSLTREYKYRYTDICLLVRSNKEGNRLANYLMDNNIPCSSPDSVFLKDGVSVKFILSVLKYINNPLDTLAYTEMAYFLYLMGKIDKDKVEDVFIAYKEKLLQQLYPIFFENIRGYKSKEISTLIYRITALFDIQDKGDVFWMQLLTSVQDLERSQPSNITNFFDWWEKDGNIIKVSSGDSDAIQIMTIHKSKGLQFPVVILPDSSWEYKPKTNSIEWLEIEEDNPFGVRGSFPVSISGALESSFFDVSYEQERQSTFIDNINLLYVALTRPEDQLYIYMPQKPTKNTLGEILLPCFKDGMKSLELVEETERYFVGEKVINERTSKRDESDLITSIVSLSGMISNEVVNLNLKRASNTIFNEAQEKGIIIHEILQKVNFKDSNWRNIISKSQRYKKWLPVIESVLEAYNSNVMVNSWYGEKTKHYTERDIYFENQYLRPDRVVMMPEDNKVVVIDYKTGEKREQHVKQVENYINALKSIEQSEVRGYLVYVDPLEIEEVF